MAHPVKWFRSDMRGAPVRNGTPGSMLAQYIACAITGFGDATMVSGSVTDNKATLVFSGGLTFFKDSVVLVQNALPASVNGEHIVKISGENTITFDVLAVDGPIGGGTVTVKYAPIGGWTLPFSGPNVGVLRSQHPESLGHYYRITDTNAFYGSVTGFENMASLSQFTGAYPPNATTNVGSGAGLQRWKSQDANTGARPWFLIGDARGFYDFYRHYMPGTINLNPVDHIFQQFYFGELLPYGNNVDNYASIVSGTNTASYNIASTSNPSYNWITNSIGANDVELSLARNAAGDAGIFKRARSTFGTGFTAHFSGSGFTPFLGPRRRLALSQPRIIDDENVIRGYYPGIFCTEQNLLFAPFTNFGVHDGTHEFFGRRMMSIMVNHSSAQTTMPVSPGYVFMDLHGPWR